MRYLSLLLLTLIVLLVTVLIKSQKVKKTMPFSSTSIVTDSVTPMLTIRKTKRHETTWVPSTSSLPTAGADTDVEFPPLYPHLNWVITRQTKATFQSFSGDLVELDGYRTDSALLETYPADFVTYYQQELAAKGWNQTMTAGSGVSGNFYGYEKNGHYLTIGVFVLRDTRGRDQLKYYAFLEHN